MGATLTQSPSKDSSPIFMIFAARDPATANLDRIQLVKGWVDETGKTHERVFDVVWSDDQQPVDGKLARLPDNVNLRTAKTTSDQGAAQLSAVWVDPEFDLDNSAFYYARVLQVPTARHSLLDRIALGKENGDDYPDVIQERAYTSPIWYAP
jgi:hypothetical protein